MIRAEVCCSVGLRPPNFELEALMWQPLTRCSRSTLIEAETRLYHVNRPSLHLGVNATYILADDSQSDQLRATKKEYRSED